MKPWAYVDHDPFEQPRHRCRVCGRTRYEKYMWSVLVTERRVSRWAWYCDVPAFRCWIGKP